MITKLEVKRQLVHLLLGFMIVIALYYDLIQAYHLFAIFGIVLFFSFTVKKGHRVFFFSELLDHLERDSEKHSLRAKGLLFYLLGAAFAALLFPKDIAMASIMILAIGDSVSRLVGPYGYLKHPFNSVKFIEGIIVGGFLAIIGAMLFVEFYPALVASSVSMLIESLDIEINGIKIDDNLSIPLISGLMMYIVMF